MPYGSTERQVTETPLGLAPGGVGILDCMVMNFQELTVTTREWMRARVELELARPNRYVSRGLSPAGLAVFPDLMRNSIQDPNGNEASLALALDRAVLWNPTELYVRKGMQHERRVNVRQASERLALTEFNTWYVAGFAHRLIDEGETECEVYRAAEPKFEHASCSSHEGQRYPLADIIDGHRAGYWPEPGDPTKLSIPAGPGCHHTIRRIRLS